MWAMPVSERELSLCLIKQRGISLGGPTCHRVRVRISWLTKVNGLGPTGQRERGERFRAQVSRRVAGVLTGVAKKCMGGGLVGTELLLAGFRIEWHRRGPKTSS